LREIQGNGGSRRRGRRRHAQGVEEDASAFGESMVVDSDEG
jgi:hypothetical protein